ncbi:MAG TPA: transporter [Steroidobacteraceae bacterium]|nr:transporter [Steroidobacteraceae bacterium]
MEPVWGSDRHGLVWAYRFAPGAAALEINSDTAAALLQASPTDTDGGFLWLHWSLSNTASERWLRTHLALPEAFYESLRDDQVSTRVEQDGSALIAVAHDVLFDSGLDSSNISTVSLCITPHLMITARRRPLRSVDRLREAVRAGRVFRSPGELLGHLLHDQADVLVDITRRSTVRVDEIEDKLLAARISFSRRELGTLRRTLVRLQRLLAPEPAALFRLLNRPPAWVGDSDLQELRQAAEEFSAAIVDSGALVERVRLLQEEFSALINERTSRTLFVLTVVTVLALPINLVAGLFGMNVGGIPLTSHPHGFVVIVSTLAAITTVLAWLALGRRRD